jgi:hypothetical protein
MNVIAFLERHFGRFAIPGLVRIIVALNALVFVCAKLNPAVIYYLNLNPAAVRHGEIWRLLTYILIPGTDSYFWILFALAFLWMIGDGLEVAWGAFRLNLFYLVGMIGTTVAAFFFGAGDSNTMLNLSLYFAFSWFYPNMEVYFMAILPVRIKWLAMGMAGWLVFQFALGSLAFKMAVLASLANFLIFFGSEMIGLFRQRGTAAVRRKAYPQASLPEEEPLHRCIVCQRTDRSHPELEFRVSRDGNDYCMEHLPKPAA